MEQDKSPSGNSNAATGLAMEPYPVLDFARDANQWSCASPELLAVILFGTSPSQHPLKNGEVVRLDQRVDAPVELIVEGDIVARGKLVHDRGRTGIQITELVNQTSLAEKLSGIEHRGRARCGLIFAALDLHVDK